MASFVVISLHQIYGLLLYFSYITVSRLQVCLVSSLISYIIILLILSFAYICHIASHLCEQNVLYSNVS